MHTVNSLVIALVAAVGVCLPAAAQDVAKGPAKHAMADRMASGWQQMDAFHKLIAATYHPVKSKKDLRPLREKADSLAAAARAWAASTPPASCASEEVRTTIGTISTDALALGNQVLAGDTDAALTTAITGLHSRFEKVEMQCGGHDMKGMKH